MRVAFVLFVVTALIAACSSIDCPVENSVNMVYMVYNDNNEPDTLKDTLTIFTTRRDGSDSVLVNYAVDTDTFKLPVSYTDPEDTLFFLVWGEDYAALDTVYVAKEDEPHFESVDCSMSFFHTITGVRYTTNIIEKIEIIKTAVNYDSSEEHFHIFFKDAP